MRNIKSHELDWSKTRNVSMPNTFNDEGDDPVEIRTFVLDYPNRAQHVSIHAMTALLCDEARLVTVIGASVDVSAVKEKLEGQNVRLLNLQKALRAKHRGLILLMEPEATPEYTRLSRLIAGLNIQESTIIED